MPFSEQFIARQTADTWSLVAGQLPPGLTLAADGTVSGTSTDGGGWEAAVEVRDSAGNSAKRWLGMCVEGWEELSGSASGGGVSGSPKYSAQPSVALDAGGNPVVVWSDDNGDDKETYLKRWNGVAWAGLGASPGAKENVSNTPDDWSLDPSVALDAQGNPVVAWVQHVGSSQINIYVRRWTGTAWEDLDPHLSGIPTDASPMSDPVVLTLSTRSGMDRVFAERVFEALDGSTWRTAGSATGQGVFADARRGT